MSPSDCDVHYRCYIWDRVQPVIALLVQVATQEQLAAGEEQDRQAKGSQVVDHDPLADKEKKNVQP